MRKRTRWSATAFVVAGMMLGLAGLAWACTAQPRIVSLTPLAGPSGTLVTVRGAALTPGAPVELRWNTLADHPLAHAVADSRGDFTAEVVIPEAPPGVYSLVAVAEDIPARTAFHVTGPTASAAEPVQNVLAQDVWDTSEPVQVPVQGRGLAAAVALLALGLTGLLAGAALVATRPGRRVLAPASPTDHGPPHGP